MYHFYDRGLCVTDSRRALSCVTVKDQRPGNYIKNGQKNQRLRNDAHEFNSDSHRGYPCRHVMSRVTFYEGFVSHDRVLHKY